ncbi:hypothetical protein NQ314_021319 [Rhamnusium bicolor]|uniref:Myosin motor domain-containing protein n=1 Tax=Rhamnusium bicolor TaxID=1586634 RepID=A0AAV8WI09_9CUCU|nr:hypothetical protein NQ314_021319 [Rhamnusium bicolor]
MNKEQRRKVTWKIFMTKKDFNAVKKALTALDFTDLEQTDMFSIISAILHLGNIGFSEDEGISTILKPEVVDTVSKVVK